MAAPRKNLRTRSNTSSKSSETQTESRQNESQESTKPSETTLEQEEKTEGTSSPSSPTDEDANAALFADADAQAAQDAESDDEDADEEEDGEEGDDSSESDSEPVGVTPHDPDVIETDKKGNVINEYGVVAVGPLREFDVSDLRGGYSFKAHVEHNILIVAEDAWREVSLPGTKKTTRLLAVHRGETLPRREYEKFAVEKINEADESKGV